MMAGLVFFFENGALKFKTYYKPYCRQFRNTDSRYGAGSSRLIENVLKPNRAPGARSQPRHSLCIIDGALATMAACTICRVDTVLRLAYVCSPLIMSGNISYCAYLYGLPIKFISVHYNLLTEIHTKFEIFHYKLTNIHYNETPKTKFLRTWPPIHCETLPHTKHLRGANF